MQRLLVLKNDAIHRWGYSGKCKLAIFVFMCFETDAGTHWDYETNEWRAEGLLCVHYEADAWDSVGNLYRNWIKMSTSKVLNNG